MTIERLITFYKTCNSLGFVQLVHDEKSNGTIAIIAPTSFVPTNKKCFNVFITNNDEVDFYNIINKTCYISIKRSEKVINALVKMQAKLIKKYSKRANITIEINLRFKHNKVIAYALANNKKVMTRRIKLFTVNNNAKQSKREPHSH